MSVRAADRLYDECARAIRAGRIDSRSPIGDATLDYRDTRFPDGDPDDAYGSGAASTEPSEFERGRQSGIQEAMRRLS